MRSYSSPELICPNRSLPFTLKRIAPTESLLGMANARQFFQFLPPLYQRKRSQSWAACGNRSLIQYCSLPGRVSFSSRQGLILASWVSLRFDFETDVSP